MNTHPAHKIKKEKQISQNNNIPTNYSGSKWKKLY